MTASLFSVLLSIWVLILNLSQPEHLKWFGFQLSAVLMLVAAIAAVLGH